MFRSGIFAIVFLFAVPQFNASADTATWQFSASLTVVEDNGGILGGQFSAGDPVSGAYSFDTTVLDSDPDDPIEGIYLDLAQMVSGELGGVSFYGDGTGSSVCAMRSQSTNDVYIFEADIDFLDSEFIFSLAVLDHPGRLFDEPNSLFTTPPPIDGANEAVIELFTLDYSVYIVGNLTSLTPEPTTLALVCALGVALLRKTSP